MKIWPRKKINHSIDHQQRVYNEGVNKLTVVNRNGKTIELDDGRILTEFVSCSHLGLETHPNLTAAVVEAVNKFGVQLSVARARTKVELFDQLESKLNKIMNGSFTLIFNAVTPCHTTTLPLLAAGVLPHYSFNEKPHFIIEKTTHATLQTHTGILEQFGTVEQVDYNNPLAIELAFKSASGDGLKPISISDSINSMGRTAPILKIIELANLYDGIAYIDDTHGISIYGDCGSGYVMEQLNNKLNNKVIISGSLSKAFGAYGGFITCNFKDTIRFIKTYRTTYAFGGSPSLTDIAACVASADLHLNGTVDKLQIILRDVIKHFDDVFFDIETINAGTNIPIRGIVIGDENEAITKCNKLHDLGFSTTVAIYPTVEKGQAILRCALSSAHTKQQIESLKYNFTKSN
ncbi:aminotransferase [Photobacterium phosphoreum]|uniref:Aminotransferase n=1 Tax=Photobacterium phosphoreum TaxID=659 RepID=A0A2T3JTJ1_PHOPO|nr:aminotransferase class I/II-fold pyridoxal phosphate-dependent enzyme [Photobacterium phosphoreum]PSU25861.1 aminotransferase [Photobacterium phosphoreum]PSU35368.1 aminotransferase [Photobacterium phosphoreum]PSU52504.1 aminotransferase [Photobacterium phosphoreum]